MSITEIDANGRIRLPMGIRDKLDLNEGDKLAVDQLGDGNYHPEEACQKNELDDSEVIG